MQNSQTQNPTTSESSPSVADFIVQFTEKEFPHFRAEYAEKSGDLLYHFWPPGQESAFCDGFHLHLERAFQKVLPPDTEVEADYTDLEEAKVLMGQGNGLVPQKDSELESVEPKETYFVRVIGVADIPFADVFLKQRVFEAIEKEIEEQH